MSNPTTWLKFGLFAVGLGQSFAFVLVPPLARDLGLSVIETSTIFSISAVAWALTSASWGRASDKYGRRNIAVIGLIGYSVSIIALITPLFLVEKKILDLVYLLPLLVLGRLINGLVGSATRPAAFAYMADISERAKRTKKFARLESSFLIGTIMGPMIGGFLFLYSKSLPFYVFAFCGFVAAIGIFLTFPKHIVPREKVDEALGKLSYKDKSVWPFLFIAALSSLCQASLLQSIGFFITDIFSDEKDLPLVISLTFVVLSISTVVSQYIFTDLNDDLITNFSYFNRYAIKSSIEASLILCFFENLNRSFNLAILPSSFITSQITELGFSLDSLEISTEASVWPALSKTPPFLATKGKTCPGDTISLFLTFEFIAVLIVLARS